MIERVMSAVNNAGDAVGNFIPEAMRGTMMLRTFGLVKVPMILYCSPSVEQLSDSGCAVRIPLSWRTKNHYHSMYFGALAVGADCAGGLIAMYHIRKGGEKIALLFKDVKAEFFKRANGDVLFRCNDGLMIQEAVREAASTGARVNRTLTIVATVPSISATEEVARFALTISLKVQGLS